MNLTEDEHFEYKAHKINIKLKVKKWIKEIAKEICLAQKANEVRPLSDLKIEK